MSEFGPGWATRLGLPDCIEREFEVEHGRAPWATAELCEWANASGRRSPAGVWRCLGMADEPKVIDLGTTLAPVRAWIYRNPGPAAAAALLAYLVMVGTGKRRRR